ncbi:hypothetical protein [Streptomyces sp. NPDC002559]
MTPLHPTVLILSDRFRLRLRLRLDERAEGAAATTHDETADPER